VTIEGADIEISGTNSVTIGGASIGITSSIFSHNGKNIGDDHEHEGSPTAPIGAISDTGPPT